MTRVRITSQILLGASLLFPAAARAQFQIDWYTVDGGGGTSTGGAFSLTGTMGQPDAGSASGGTFACAGGFWGAAAATLPCYANCDGSTTPPVVNTGDFTCFLQQYSAAVPLASAQQQAHYANCDGSTTFPQVNTADFTCFLQKYAAGCP
jgi:hypothetical protein